MAWIRWNEVLNTFENGGLNIGSLKALNIGLLGKWWWRFKKESDAFWRSAIVSLHGIGGKLGDTRVVGSWGDICKLKIGNDPFSLDLRNLFFEDVDGWNWGLEDDGRFTVASLRKVVDDTLLQKNSVPTNWFKCCPGKANILLWRACLNRLPTRANLLRRGIHINSSLCPLCNLLEETVTRLFLECPLTMEIISLLKKWFPDFIDDGESMVGVVAKMILGLKRRPNLSAFIHLAFLWSIWSYRNLIVHNGKGKRGMELVAEIKFTTFIWYRSRVKNAFSLDWDVWYVSPIDCISLNNN